MQIALIEVIDSDKDYEVREHGSPKTPAKPFVSAVSRYGVFGCSEPSRHVWRLRNEQSQDVSNPPTYP